MAMYVSLITMVYTAQSSSRTDTHLHTCQKLLTALTENWMTSRPLSKGLLCWGKPSFSTTFSAPGRAADPIAGTHYHHPTRRPATPPHTCQHAIENAVSVGTTYRVTHYYLRISHTEQRVNCVAIPAKHFLSTYVHGCLEVDTELIRSKEAQSNNVYSCFSLPQS